MERVAKRIKSKHITVNEKEILISAILEKKNVIENKQNDKVSIVVKTKAWEEITQQFNSISSVKRSTEQLRTFYTNAKSDIKKQLAENRRENCKTGGGKRTSPAINEDNPLLALVQEQSATVPNPFDCDRELYPEENETLSPGSPDLFENTLGDDVLAEDEDEENNEPIAESTLKRPRLSGPSAYLRREQTRRGQKTTQQNEQTRKILLEIAELKKEKLKAEIEKTRAKIRVYELKRKVLKEISGSAPN